MAAAQDAEGKVSKYEDEDGIEGPWVKAMEQEEPRHAKSTANPDWPYENRCAACGEEWPCMYMAAPDLLKAEGKVSAPAGFVELHDAELREGRTSSNPPRLIGVRHIVSVSPSVFGEGTHVTTIGGGVFVALETYEFVLDSIASAGGWGK